MLNPYEEVLKVKRDAVELIHTLDTTDLEYFEEDDLYALAEIAKLLAEKATHVANMIKFE